MTWSNKEAVARYRVNHEVKWSLDKYCGIEGIDYVECKICSKRSLYIDSRHLKTRHNLNKKEYLQLFPNASIISKKKIRIQSKSAKGNKANQGLKFSKVHKDKISKAQIENNSFKDKHHTKETRNLISKLMTNRIINDKRFSTGGYSKKGYFFSEKNSKMFFYRSSWEKRFMEQLEEDRSTFFYEVEPFAIEYKFDGSIHRYIPDFLINDELIVEIKPRFKLEEPQTIAKIKECNVYANVYGYTYKIVSF